MNLPIASQPKQRSFAARQASSNTTARSRPVFPHRESLSRDRTAILMIDAEVGTNIMSERFTETLRAASEPGWSQAVGHRLVKELFAGAVPATADTFEAKLRFARFIGMVSGEENTYFLRAFKALGVTEDRRAADPDT